MRPVRETCTLRPEVLQGDLEDAIFGADFGQVLKGAAPPVYQDPVTFFANTYPATALRKLVGVVFERLASPTEAGAVIRLSTGYGGGKTHTLISLWHLARNLGSLALGTELLPAAGRPSKVAVAGFDGDKTGSEVVARHGNVITHSLWGELAFQLGGRAGYTQMQEVDDPGTVPDADLIAAMLGADKPTLILLDELVLYMAKLTPQRSQALVMFINALISTVRGRKRTVLLITDPGDQAATRREAATLEEHLRNLDEIAGLNDVLGRKMSDFDPIGGESAQVIVRRLFSNVDRAAADQASAEYYQAYQRIVREYPDALPAHAAGREYAERILTCYPFHPRLLDTARDRLGVIQDFQKSRGVLRLFARILRYVWESDATLPLICAGDLDWGSERIQADLLARLNKDSFKAAVDADILRHARDLDAELSTDIHRRVASALLLESLAPQGAMDVKDLGLATLRPSDVGNEPREAIDRLLSVCWHTYRTTTGDKYQFRDAPNANKIIEETVEQIPMADARAGVLTLAQDYFRGGPFDLVAYPSSASAVPDSARLKLVLTDSETAARAVCDYLDDDPGALRPRPFRNAILAVAPTTEALTQAAQAWRRAEAAAKVVHDHRDNRELVRQVKETIMPTLTRRAKLAAYRAFTRVVFQGRPAVSLEEKYLVNEENVLANPRGQEKLKAFLDDARLIFGPSEAVDVDLLIERVFPAAAPSVAHPGAHPASAIHEAALASDRLRLMLDAAPIRNSILRGISDGKLVVRLADGKCYDAQGCVTGPPDDRRRVPERLSTFTLSDEVLVAPTSAPCVSDWLAVVPREPLPPEPQPTVVSPTSVSGWDAVLEEAARRPLLRATLTARSLEPARRLVALAQPLAAQRTTLSITAAGTLPEGGQVNFGVNEAKVGSALRPLDLAERITRGVQQVEEFTASLELDFGKQGLSGAQARLAQAREQGAEGVEIAADFEGEQ